jgi:hypothetical protein
LAALGGEAVLEAYTGDLRPMIQAVVGAGAD